MNKTHRLRLVLWLSYMATSISKVCNAYLSPLFNLIHCGRWAGPFGHPGEPISSVIGKVKRQNGGKIPRKHWIMRLVDKFLEKLDPAHSLGAIKDDRDPRWPR